ncbi:MAG TPA: polyprenyl synthetase family protein [Bacteroidales bacterium]|nr:polyprenyl synthetase family protein [Bacteroidales bacterium]
MKTPITLSEIREPVKEPLKRFDASFADLMKSPVQLLTLALRYILLRKGKQMRPLFVFLSASACGQPGERTQRAAALVELLHTASLVHDDVVDDSHKRRGFLSINALWKNKFAVLMGDYLLSKGLLLALEHDDFDLLKIISTATREMSEGELLQIEKARHLNIDENTYFEIISKKTASLISACCKAGAASVGAPEDVVDKMNAFGQYTGLAFQLKDDIFDYQAGNSTGKPQAIDIREKKMTLPLIYTLQHASASDRLFIRRTIRSYSSDSKRVATLIRMVDEAGGLRYAAEQMHQNRNKALAILSEFPVSEALIALGKLVDFTIERDR